MVKHLHFEDASFVNHSGSAIALRHTSSEVALQVIRRAGFTTFHTLEGGTLLEQRFLHLGVTFNSTFSGNSAELGGVVFAEQNCTVTIVCSRFISNLATGPSAYGEVVYSEGDCSVAVLDSIFERNSVDGPLYWSGGGVFVVVNATVYIHRCLFTLNKSFYIGGVVYAKGDYSNTDTKSSLLIIDESVFTYNLAVSSLGGVLIADNTHSSITKCNLMIKSRFSRSYKYI